MYTWGSGLLGCLVVGQRWSVVWWCAVGDCGEGGWCWVDVWFPWGNSWCVTEHKKHYRVGGWYCFLVVWWAGCRRVRRGVHRGWAGDWRSDFLFGGVGKGVFVWRSCGFPQRLVRGVGRLFRCVVGVVVSGGWRRPACGFGCFGGIGASSQAILVGRVVRQAGCGTCCRRVAGCWGSRWGAASNPPRVDSRGRSAYRSFLTLHYGGAGGEGLSWSDWPGRGACFRRL